MKIRKRKSKEGNSHHIIHTVTIQFFSFLCCSACVC